MCIDFGYSIARDAVDLQEPAAKIEVISIGRNCDREYLFSAATDDWPKVRIKLTGRYLDGRNGPLALAARYEKVASNVEAAVGLDGRKNRSLVWSVGIGIWWRLGRIKVDGSEHRCRRVVCT